jgi:putative SOS response-associated peptidase YedK
VCGRFKLTSPPAIVADVFGVEASIALSPRYNVAPSQSVAAIRVDEEGGRALALLRWGLVPSWAKDPAIGNRMINARSESVAEKPAFRRALAERRCLVIADGFYEWQRATAGKKVACLFSPRDQRPFGFAGLWERWRRGDETIESCTILTTAAVGVVTRIHDRMPVVVPAPLHAAWLGRSTETVPAERILADVLAAQGAAEFVGRDVGSYVNDPRNDDPACLGSEP